MSYAEEIAPMPQWGDKNITMEALVRSYLANAQEGYGRAHALMNRAFADGHSDADMLAYVLHLHTWLWQAEVASLLMRLQAVTPAEDHDGIAETYISESQSGDYYPEMLWEWLEQRGIDPQRLYDEGQAAAKGPRFGGTGTGNQPNRTQEES